MISAHVLIVEDEEICAGFIDNILSSEGYQTTHVSDGESAWRMLQNDPEQFQAILLDRNLPSMDGLSLLQQLKESPALRDIPVIMETASGDDQSIREGLDAGAYYYLVKPLQADLLLAITAVAIQHAYEQRLMRETVREAEISLIHLYQGVFFIRTLDEARSLAKVLAQICPDPGKVIMGLQELLINAIEHGNLGIKYADKTQLIIEGRWQNEVEQRLALPENISKRVEIRFERSPDKIKITIKDQGLGFDWQGFLYFDPGRAFDLHGRGIAMARIMSFDSLNYVGNGNIVEVAIYCSG